jgi:8-oxo-dGTP diphosphatase
VLFNKIKKKILKKGAFAIILNDKNQVLLALRDDMPIWNLIGGGVEEGETFEQGLLREIKEEACFEAEIVRQSRHYRNTESNGNVTEVKSYLCKIKNGTPKLGNEGVCLQFFDLDKLPKNFVPKQKGRLDDCLKSEQVVERVQNEPSTKELLKTLKRDELVGLDKWLKNPKVLEQRTNGTLQYDIK